MDAKTLVDVVTAKNTSSSAQNAPVSSIRKGNKIVYTMKDGTTRTKMYREQTMFNYAR
jgi:hypothetical protein